MIGPPIRITHVRGELFWNAEDVVELLKFAANFAAEENLEMASRAFDGLAKDMEQYLETDQILGTIPMMVLPV